jgi:hypothetical protein
MSTHLMTTMLHARDMCVSFVLAKMSTHLMSSILHAREYCASLFTTIHATRFPTPGKVKAMRGPDGKSIKSAGPSQPVEIVGWRSMPEVGDVVLEAPNEKRAKDACEYRAAQLEAEIMGTADTEIRRDRKVCGACARTHSLANTHTHTHTHTTHTHTHAHTRTRTRTHTHTHMNT